MENDVQPRESKWDWKEHKPNNMFSIPVKSESDLYKWWCRLLNSVIVELTPREIDIVASFLKERQRLSKEVPEEFVDRMLMSNESQNEILKECNVTQGYLYVVKNNLKKKHVFINNSINPKMIPNIRRNDDGTFLLLITINKTDDK